jgi:hypothetical protein
LSLLVLQQYNFFPEVQASQKYHPSWLPLNEDGSLNVRLSNLEEIDVNISGISTYDELEVEIQELAEGPVRVELE